MEYLNRKHLWIAALFFLLTTAIYARSLPNAFVNWDDYLLIRDNPIAHGISPANLYGAFTTFDPELYVPLTILSYQIDWMLGWGSPVMFHLTNLVLHTLNALLVACVMVFLLRKPLTPAFSQGERETPAPSYQLLAPVLAGLLFAVHPLNTEAVAWASSRKDLLSTFFFLGSLCSFLLYRRCSEGSFSAKRFYWMSVGAFLFALLAKVSVISLPVVLLLLHWRERRGFSRKLLWEVLPFVLLAVFFGAVAVLGKPSGTVFPWVKMLIAGKSMLFYLQKFFWPTELSVLYPYTAPISFWTPDLLWSFIGVVSLMLIATLSLWRTREVFFAWAFYVVTLLPSFVNIMKSGGAQLDVYFASDRYVYVPMIALLYVCALLLPRVRRDWGLVAGSGGILTFLVVLVIPFSVLSHRQSLVWRDTETLFSHVLAHYPNSQIAHNNIGALRYREGDIEGSIKKFRESLSIRPTETAFFNLGRALMALGREAEAIEAYQGSLVMNPRYTDTLINLGVYLMDRNELETATAYFERAVATNEKETILTSLYNLGLVYQKQGRNEDALATFRELLERDPGDREAAEWVEELSR